MVEEGWNNTAEEWEDWSSGGSPHLLQRLQLYQTYTFHILHLHVLYFSYLTWTQSQCWKVISPEDRPSLRLQRQSSGRSGSMLERQRCKLNYSYAANTFCLLNLLPVKFHVFQNLGGYLDERNLCVTCVMM